MLHQRPAFDVVVLTAANEAQAQGYRAQLNARRTSGLLDERTEYLVIADPAGRRVGSGTSTLVVLAELSGHFKTEGANPFAGRCILIAHSGGDARRLPAYAPLGKIFLPMPCDVTPSQAAPWRRFPAALFDLLLQRLVQLPCPAEGQIVICSGDVLLTFDATSLDIPGGNGITGLGFPAAPELGRHHGVYITPNSSEGGRVTGFLQKPGVEELRRHAALDLSGRVLIDSGVLCLSPDAALTLMEAAGFQWDNGVAQRGTGVYADVLSGKVSLVDLYQEIALALPRNTNREEYLQSIAPANQTPEARQSLGEFFEKLRVASLPFYVVAVPDGEFFHVGTNRDLLARFTQPSRTRRQSGFQNGCRVTPDLLEALRNAAKSSGSESVFFNNSGSWDGFSTQGTVYLESCDLKADSTQNFTLSGDNIITEWKSPPTGLSGLPTGIGITFLPVQNGDFSQTVPVLFGVDDDNKATAESGLCQFLNQPIERLFEAGISPSFLWDDEGEHSTWTARLWLAGDAGNSALSLLLEAVGVTTNDKKSRQNAAAALLKLWQGQERFNWPQLLAQLDYARLVRHRENVAAHFEGEHLFDDLLRYDNYPADEALARLNSFDDIVIHQRLLDKIQHWHEQRQTEPFEKAETGTRLLTEARIMRAGALIAEAIEQKTTPGDASLLSATLRSATFNHIAFHSISRAMESAIELPHEPRPAEILEDQVVWVTAPARIDFAGGWSDTPPICFERGGTVLNAAVTINRQYPIQVVAKLNKDRCIRLTSIDLGSQAIFRTAEEINGTPDLGHWSSLAKAALVLSGIVPERRENSSAPQSLEHWMDVLGGGLDLTLFSGLPKGSGMGTSSILGAATLACLTRVLGQELTHAELITQTSLLEQRMTTGGGWQDQIGGVLAGVKLIRTEPGISQTPSTQWSVFGAPGRVERSGTGAENAADLLSRRLLLYYTGQKRLAKNILQNVVGRYLAREPALLAIIDRLKQGAMEAKLALEANDIAAFADRVAEYWELKKAVDPSSTNAEIEAILQRVQPYTSAYSLCGAGGGGFMLLIARDEMTAGQILRELQNDPPNAHARFFHFTIDSQGLAVTTL